MNNRKKIEQFCILHGLKINILTFKRDNNIYNGSYWHLDVRIGDTDECFESIGDSQDTAVEEMLEDVTECMETFSIEKEQEHKQQHQEDIDNYMTPEYH